jgi:hypothetical protein
MCTVCFCFADEIRPEQLGCSQSLLPVRRCGRVIIDDNRDDVTYSDFRVYCGIAHVHHRYTVDLHVMCKCTFIDCFTPARTDFPNTVTYLEICSENVDLIPGYMCCILGHYVNGRFVNSCFLYKLTDEIKLFYNCS